jgi:hypothetical protein
MFLIPVDRALDLDLLQRTRRINMLRTDLRTGADEGTLPDAFIRGDFLLPLFTAAIDEAVPTPVLTTALYERFSSRGEALFQDKLLSAMRFEFGGHIEKPEPK